MSKARTRAHERRALAALLLVVVLSSAAVGCSRGGTLDDCRSITPGTLVGSLPAVHTPGVVDPSCPPLVGTTDELNALRCCSYPYYPRDGGVVECSGRTVDCNQLPPADYYSLGEPYGGGLCQDDWAERFWACGVWVRDGSVLGVCGYCPQD